MPPRTNLLGLLTLALAACGSAPVSEDGSAGVGRLPGDNPTSGMVLSGPPIVYVDGTRAD